MTAKNIIESIREGARFMIVPGDSEDVVLAHTPEGAAGYVYSLQQTGFDAPIAVLLIQMIAPKP